MEGLDAEYGERRRRRVDDEGPRRVAGAGDEADPAIGGRRDNGRSEHRRAIEVRCALRLGDGGRTLVAARRRRSHPIAPYEVPLRVGNDFSVGRMIHGLNPNNSCLELLVVVLHVPEEFELR